MIVFEAKIVYSFGVNSPTEFIPNSRVQEKQI